MLNRFPDFSDRMQEHGGMFDSPAGLFGQIVQVLTHRAKFADQRRQVMIQFGQKLLGLCHRLAHLNQ